MQKCLDLKRLLITASERYYKKTTHVYYSIGKISPQTNIAKKKIWARMANKIFRVAAILPGRWWEGKQTIFHFWPRVRKKKSGT